MKDKHSKTTKAIWTGLLLAGLFFCMVGVLKPQTVNAVTTTSKSTQAKYPYLIKVNKKMNTVTIYKKDAKGKYTVPVKAMVCSTGKNTPIGTFRTKAKYRWKWLYGNVYGQYSTRITGPILFHSVYYYKRNPSTLSVKEFNKLGTSASMGCVRLQVADTKWIYDHCKVGTTVVIYNSNNPGPLGKPKAIKMSSKITWDPTDTTNKKNPFNKKKPTITGASNLTIAYGSTYSPKKNIKAYNTCGYDITSALKVKSNVNTKVAGTYSVSYSVTDTLKRTTTKTIKVTVKPKAGLPTIIGVTDKLYRYSQYNSLPLSSYVLRGISANVGGQKLGSAYLKYSVKTIAKNESMVQYEITYYVTNGSFTAKKLAYITLDNQAPVITGIQDLALTKEQFDDLTAKLGVNNYEGISFSDNCSSTENIVVTTTMTMVDATNYHLTYTATDQVGLTTTVTVNIQILPDIG